MSFVRLADHAGSGLPIPAAAGQDHEHILFAPNPPPLATPPIDGHADEADYDFETRAVRAGFERTQFGEHSEPIFLTSSFVHTSAANAAAKFSNEIDGYIYSRFRNPTVRLFQDRLASLEGAEAVPRHRVRHVRDPVGDPQPHPER